MREPEEEKAPIGIPLSDLSFDQLMDIEDNEDRIDKKRRSLSYAKCGTRCGTNSQARAAETSEITIGYSNCLVLLLGTRPVIPTPRRKEQRNGQ